jgi:hypothetical protein
MRLVLVALLAGSLSIAAGQSEGMLPRWEVAELSKSIVENTDQLKKVLEQINPARWPEQGPSRVYQEQYQSLQAELENLRLSAEALGRKPEKLSVVVDTFLWLDRTDSMIGSLSAGVRRYQSPALSDVLDSVKGKGDAAAASLKEYMRQVAVQQEAAMEIADREAQRCRERLASEPRR